MSYGLQCALNTISGYSSAAASVVYSKAKTLADAIGESFAQALAKPKPSYNSTHELHHIVAQNAQRAKPARDILQDLGIDVENDSDNLILIQTGLYKRLHRVLYYEFVNKVIIAANNAGGTSRVKREKNVRRALKFIRAMISGLNANAPF